MQHVGGSAHCAGCAVFSVLAGRVKGSFRDHDPVSLGIPSVDDDVSQYVSCVRERVPPLWSVYVAFALFRMAAINQGVYKRYLIGISNMRDVMRNYNIMSAGRNFFTVKC